MRRKYIAVLLGVLTVAGIWSIANAQSSIGKMQNKPQNKPQNKQISLTVFVSEVKELKEKIAPALVCIQQPFLVRDDEGYEYTRNGNDYFSLVPSVCYETKGGTVISGNVREPWLTDGEYMPHKDDYEAFLYESPREAPLFGQTTLKNFEQLNTSEYIKPLGKEGWNLWVYDNGIPTPSDRRFECDSSSGNKKGIMVWFVMPKGNSSPDSISMVSTPHEVTLKGTTDMWQHAVSPTESLLKKEPHAVLPKISQEKIVIGGCFLIPNDSTSVGYKLVGVASLNNNGKNWYVYYPFVKFKPTATPSVSIQPSAPVNQEVEGDDGATQIGEEVSSGEKAAALKNMIEQLQNTEQSEVNLVKMKCGCWVVPCENHKNEKELDKDCEKCEVPFPCKKHKKYFDKKKEDSEKKSDNKSGKK